MGKYKEFFEERMREDDSANRELSDIVNQKELSAKEREKAGKQLLARTSSWSSLLYIMRIPFLKRKAWRKLIKGKPNNFELIQIMNFIGTPKFARIKAAEKILKQKPSSEELLHIIVNHNTLPLYLSIKAADQLLSRYKVPNDIVIENDFEYTEDGVTKGIREAFFDTIREIRFEVLEPKQEQRREDLVIIMALIHSERIRKEAIEQLTELRPNGSEKHRIYKSALSISPSFLKKVIKRNVQNELKKAGIGASIGVELDRETKEIIKTLREFERKHH